MNFEDIGYLLKGNSRQREAHMALEKAGVFSKLKSFDPILVGIIPINVDVETSDLDVICCFSDRQEFRRSVTDSFEKEKDFRIREKENAGIVVVSFIADDFEIEIFGQSVPTRQQAAYLHMVAEYKLLEQHGDALRQRIVELKRAGYKTEPAFAVALGLKGDPYTELLNPDLGKIEH